MFKKFTRLKIIKKIDNLDRATEWKLINTEMYLSKIFSLEKNIKI